MDTKINMSVKKKGGHRISPCSRKMFQLRRLLVSGVILPLLSFIFLAQTQGMR